MKVPWELSRREFSIVLCCIICSFAITFNNIMIKVNQENIRDMFDADYALASAFSDIVSISYVAFFLLAIAITDKYGKRFSMMAGLVILGTTSFISVFSPSLLFLVWVRVATGFGVTLMSTVGLSVITDVVSDRYLGEALSLLFASNCVASVFSPFIAQYVVSAASLKALFFLMVPICIALLFVARKMDNTRVRPDMKIDKPMNIMYLLAVLFILGPFIYPSLSYSKYILIFGIVCAVIFGFLYARSKNRNFDLALFKNKMFSISALMALIMYFCSYGIEDSLSRLFQFMDTNVTLFGIVVASASLSAFFTSFKPLVQAIISPSLGKYFGRRDPNGAVLIGYILMMVSTVVSVILMMMTVPELAIIFVTVIYVLHAFANAIFSPQNKRIMMSSVAPEDRNAASSFSSVISVLGSVFATIVLVNLVKDSTTMGSYRDSSCILFGVVLVVSILGLIVIRWRRKIGSSRES